MSKYKFYYSIVDSFPPYRVDVAELFTILSHSKGIDIEWYMTCDKPSLSLNATFSNQKVNLPVMIAGHNIVTNIINKFSYWVFDVVAIVLLLFKRVDLIQVRDKYIVALIGLLIAKLKGTKFVYWCSYPFPEHDLESYLSSKRGVSGYFYKLRSMFGHLTLYKIVIPNSSHTFVQSEQMLKDITAYSVNSKKMTPVPMGVPKRLLSWKVDSKQETIQNRVVYLGTLASVRKLEVIIDAFYIVNSKKPKAQLLIVGDGDFSFERERLESQVNKLGLSGSVIFTGFVPIEDAWSLTASAEICLSPFYPTKVLASTSPTKLVEYMALGKPVVCNDHPEQSEIINKSGAGLCVSWGAQEFADAILWMLEHPDDAKEMGKKGPEWVKRNRTYSVISEQVWQQYQKLLGDN